MNYSDIRYLEDGDCMVLRFLLATTIFFSSIHPFIYFVNENVVIKILCVTVMCILYLVISCFCDITNGDFQYRITKTPIYYDQYALRPLYALTLATYQTLLIIEESYKFNLGIQMIIIVSIIFLPRMNLNWFENERYSIWTRTSNIILVEFQKAFELFDPSLANHINNLAKIQFEKSYEKSKRWTNYPNSIKTMEHPKFDKTKKPTIEDIQYFDILKREIKDLKIEEFEAPFTTIQNHFFEGDIVMINDIKEFKHLPLRIESIREKTIKFQTFGGRTLEIDKNYVCSREMNHAKKDEICQFLYSKENLAKEIFRVLHAKHNELYELKYTPSLLFSYLF